MRLQMRYLWQLISIARSGKKIIVYGFGAEMQKVKEIIEYYDGNIAYAVNDFASIDEKSYVDLIYEDVEQIYVIIVKEDYLEACQNLESIGLKQYFNYTVVHKSMYSNYFQKFPLDINIGYTYNVSDTDPKLPGVTVFGNKEKPYVVVTLGSSTSDSQAFIWKCWSEILYDKIVSKKLINEGNIVLYSAGVSAYRSSQELLKLVRDMLNLSPNMVISFSGVNDIGKMIYPFVQYYQCQIFDTILPYQQTDMNGSKIIPSYSCGFERTGTNAENWVKHMRIMHAICQEYGIIFHSFLEPMLGAKKSILSRSEKEIVLNDNTNIMEKTVPFINEVRQIIAKSKLDYIHDITDLFNECDNVYIDNCHVTEEGNRMIADKICSTIIQ